MGGIGGDSGTLIRIWEFNKMKKKSKKKKMELKETDRGKFFSLLNKASQPLPKEDA